MEKRHIGEEELIFKQFIEYLSRLEYEEMSSAVTVMCTNIFNNTSTSLTEAVGRAELVVHQLVTAMIDPVNFVSQLRKNMQNIAGDKKHE